MANITSDGAYVEKVLTTFADGSSIEGTRAYTLTQDENTLQLIFADGPDNGKLFQIFDMREAEPTSTHHCKADTYVSTFTYKDANSFVLEHRVSGPAKDYTMTTIYTRT